MRPLLLVATFALAAIPSQAQVSIGGQVGDPTGLSLKLGYGPGAVLVAAGWDLDDRVTAELHYLLRSRRLEGSSSARLFYGPGVFVNTNDDDTDLGVSLGIGLEALVIDDIEVYGIVSPRLQLVDETDFDLGAGLGLRLRL